MKSILKTGMIALSLVMIAGLMMPTPAKAQTPNFGMVWYECEQLRTVVPPSSDPNSGRDPLYMVPGTGGVAGVAPGEPGWHGGHWKVYTATWNVPQYQLCSASAVHDAEAAGDITLERRPDLDVRCPLQPGRGHGRGGNH